MAHLRNAGVRWECPELEEDRKWVADRQTDASDPLRESPLVRQRPDML
jgi:hypothetical protein